MKNLMKPRPLLLFVQRIKEPTAAAGQRIQRETHTHSIYKVVVRCYRRRRPPPAIA